MAEPSGRWEWESGDAVSAQNHPIFVKSRIVLLVTKDTTVCSSLLSYARAS